MENHSKSTLGKYREEFAEQAGKLCMLLGATNERLAKFFGVSTTTIDNWIADKAEFREAVLAGREIADAEVAHALYRRAIGYQHDEEKIFCHEGGIVRAQTTKRYPPDTGAMAFWLKNRQGWRDRVELGGPNGGPIKLTVVYDDDNASEHEGGD